MDTLQAAKQANKAKSSVKKLQKTLSSTSGSERSSHKSTKSTSSKSSDSSKKKSQSREKSSKPADLSSNDPAMIESTASEVVGAIQGSSSNVQSSSNSNESSKAQSTIYLFVARDSDMIVYENHIEKKVNQAKFMADVYEILNTYQDITDIEARPSTQVKQLALDN
jgi:hypothetical protein